MFAYHPIKGRLLITSRCCICTTGWVPLLYPIPVILAPNIGLKKNTSVRLANIEKISKASMILAYKMTASECKATWIQLKFCKPDLKPQVENFWSIISFENTHLIDLNSLEFNSLEFNSLEFNSLEFNSLEFNSNSASLIVNVQTLVA
jgi:hypothetical protein